MSIDVREDWSCRLIADTPQGWVADRGFTISGAASEADALVALASLSPPVILNGPHPANANLLCDGPVARSISPNYWTATARYTYGSRSELTLASDPTFEWEFGENTEMLDHDDLGNAIMNTAGDPFSAGVSEQFPTFFFTIVKNLPTYDPRMNIAYQGFVNNDMFSPLGMFALEPGQCRCRGIAPTRPFTRKDKIIPVRYRFEARGGRVKDAVDGLWDGFKKRVLDQGTMGWYDKGGGSFQRGVFYDGDAPPQRVTGDIRLDGTGKPIDTRFKCGGKAGIGFAPVANQLTPIFPAGGVAIDSTAGSATFLKFRTFRTKAFHDIGV